jgi:hypothetical protein
LLGQVITGGIVSRTVMICTQLAELVQPSVMVWVRAIVIGQVPIGGPFEHV